MDEKEPLHLEEGFNEYIRGNILPNGQPNPAAPDEPDVPRYVNLALETLSPPRTVSRKKRLWFEQKRDTNVHHAVNELETGMDGGGPDRADVTRGFLYKTTLRAPKKKKANPKMKKFPDEKKDAGSSKKEVRSSKKEAGSREARRRRRRKPRKTKRRRRRRRRRAKPRKRKKKRGRRRAKARTQKVKVKNGRRFVFRFSRTTGKRYRQYL